MYWGGDVPWATPKDLSMLSGRRISQTSDKLTHAGFASSSVEMLPAGSVLLSSRAPIGLVAVNDVPMCTNQGFKSLIPGPDVVAEYLYWCLCYYRPLLEAAGSGSTFKELSKEGVSRFEIPLPPVSEQRRIAAALDKADDIYRARERALQRLDSLLQATFLKVFGDPVRNERNWPTAPIDQVAVDVQYGTSTNANTDRRGVPIVRMNNLTTAGRIDLTVIKWCDLSNDEVAKYAVRRGDLLFNRTNSPELVGKTAVWDRDESFAFAGYLIRVRFDESRVLPDFVSHCLNSASGKRLLAATAKPSNNMSNISASELRRLRIPIPPLELQRQFAEIVKRVSILHGRLEAALGTSRDLLSSLYARFFP